MNELITEIKNNYKSTVLKNYNVKLDLDLLMKERIKNYKKK